MAELAGDRYFIPAARRLHGPPRADAAACPHRRQSGPRGDPPEQIYLDCSHDRLAAFDLQASKIKDVLSARNVTAPGGIVETQSRNVRIDATAEFRSTQEIGDVLVGASSTGVPVHLRDLVQIWRGYQSPTQY